MRWWVIFWLWAAAPAFAFPVERCVNLGNALDAPREGEWGYTITEADLDWIAASGFDTIRLPVRFSARWDGRIDPALLARSRQVVDQALARGLRVVLDVHHFEALMTDPAGHGAQLIAIWDELSVTFEGYPEGLIFEIVNEPTERLTTAGAEALYAQIVPRLRARHPDRWIVLGGGQWSILDEMLTMQPPGHRVALTFHYYSPWEFTHQNASWMTDPPPARGWGSAEEIAVVEADMARAVSRGVPVFLGEFGVSVETKPAYRAAWMGAVREAAEAHGIGWCVWSLTASFPVFDADARDWVPGIEAALMD